MVKKAVSLDYFDALFIRAHELDRPSQRLERFEHLIEELKRQRTPLATAVSYLERLSKDNKLQIYYFGGFLRDLWLAELPRDIDIVFNKVQESLLLHAINEIPFRRNRYNGLKFELSGVKIDAWAVEDTWTFSNRFVLPSSVNILPETAFFTAESIVLEIYPPHDKRWGWESGFFKACEEKTLDIQNQHNPFPDLQLVRTYNLQAKLGWQIGQNLREYLRNYLPKVNKKSLAKTFEERYKQSIDPNELYNTLKSLSER